MQTPLPIEIPFVPGPFNWEDYAYENWIKNDHQYRDSLWYAMQFGNRDQGNMPVNDSQIKVEVLDYLASSTLEPVPPLDLNVLWKKKKIQTTTELGKTKEVPRNWETVRLASGSRETGFYDNRNGRADMSQGEKVSYWTATTQAEIEAFAAGKPEWETNTGLWGELIFYYDGNNYRLNTDQLLALKADARLPLAQTGFEIGNVRFRDRGPLINFTVYTPNGDKESMTLFPDNPEMNVQAQRFGIFGSFWVDPQNVMKKSRDHADSPTLARLAQPRLDFLQGPDKRLYYRLWSGQNIVAGGAVPNREANNQNSKPKFIVAEDTENEAEVVVERFFPQDIPGYRVISQPVGRERGAEQRAKIHVVFDGKEDTFWLRAVTPTVVPLPPEPDQIRYIYGNGRTLCFQWDFKTIDLGFGIFLKKFEQRTEPGTRMSSYFSSRVDFVEPRGQGNPAQGFSRSPGDYQTLNGGGDVLISMNRPAFFQGKGRGYRIYQSSYLGPFHPNQPQFHELYDGNIFPWETKPRESISMSTLSVNADPGRGWKYAGCFLTVIGIALFVYRRKP